MCKSIMEDVEVAEMCVRQCTIIFGECGCVFLVVLIMSAPCIVRSIYIQETADYTYIGNVYIYIVLHESYYCSNCVHCALSKL